MATILITGAARGIGLELTRQYAEDGDRVLATCRTPATAGKLHDLAAGHPDRIKVVAMDVGDRKTIDDAARAIGDTPIDVLINNAGVLPVHQELNDLDFEEWADAFNIMTMGPLRTAQAFLTNLAKASRPRIMTVSSQLGASTWPGNGLYAYSSAKAAVNRVMQLLALDLKARNVVVNLVHPGHVQTDMGGPGAAITPRESASGIRAMIAKVTMADTGKFFRWSGEPHPF